MPRTTTKKPSSWKKLFTGLLLFNIAIFLTLAILLFWPVKEVPLPQGKETTQNQSSAFIVRTTKKNLNEMIEAYLANVLKGNKYDYQVKLDKDVHLVGELPVFSSTVPLSVHLEPLVQDNGDIILKLKTISLGLLELPNKRIMEYIDDNLSKPDWVTVNPRGEEIYVALSKMDMKNNLHVQAEHIDLEANNIAFKINVPYDKLGLEKEN